LTYRRHVHYVAARAWLNSVPHGVELCFCRLTQIGFLRLLTTSAVMGDQVFSQEGAWGVYDDWLENGHASYAEEPPSIEPIFRSRSQSLLSAPKDWADSYISAFAQVTGLQLVTFDETLYRRTAGALLLKI
jgi:uncharacterized protein